MDNIREWISDNLRYILLGLALVLVMAVAVIGIRAIGNIANGKDPLPIVNKTEQTTEAETVSNVIVETENESEDAGSLTENDAKVLTTMTSYYAARTNGDTATLQKLDPSSSEQAQSSMINSYVESYSNIRTYSKKGVTDGSYVVYVCYDGKVKDIDTLVPSLTEFYLMSNEDGSLYIANTEGDAEAEQFIKDAQATAEVQALIASVSEECKNAEDSDPALKEFMSQYGNSSDGDTQSEDTTGTGTEVVANDICNIRAEANTDSEIYGELYVGETITKLGETGDGWTEVDFNGQTAYIKSEFLSTAEEIQEQQEAEYFAPGQ